MQIKLNNSLLYATLEITYNGKSKILEDIIVDTGAAHSIICPDIVEDLGIEDSPEDELITMYGVGGIQYAYRKKIETIKFGSCLVKGYKLMVCFLYDFKKSVSLVFSDLL